MRLREGNKIVLQDIQYFMAYHYFQKIGLFLTDHLIFQQKLLFSITGKMRLTGRNIVQFYVGIIPQY